MLVSTTNTLDGHEVTAYLGFVSSEAIMGTNLFKDFFASIRDTVGIDLDYETIGAGNMLMVIASGTVVVVSQ